MTQLRNDNRKFANHVVGEICRAAGQEARGTLSPQQSKDVESLLSAAYGYIAYARTMELAGEYKAHEWDEMANEIHNDGKE